MKSLYSHITGNDEVKAYLTRIAETQMIPHSFLFTGEKLQDISEYARAFASGIASPADIHEYNPEGKVGMHSIETMRRFSSEVYLEPFNSEKKVFIIHDADRMLPTSANALLKTFEEPAKTSIIILTSRRTTSLLPTILSRCTTVRFQGTEKPILSEPILKVLAQGSFKTYQELKNAAGEIGKTIEESYEAKKTEMLANNSDEKEVDGVIAMQSAIEAKEIFNTILFWYRDKQLLETGGDHTYLMNPTFVEEISKSKAIPLERVQKILADAKLSLERFTSLTMVLERLFLELDFL
jgi:DNA polymerase-3 subunit delta'